MPCRATTHLGQTSKERGDVMDSGTSRVLVLSTALPPDAIPGAEEHGVGDVEGAWSQMCRCQHLFVARLETTLVDRGGRERGSGCRCLWRREDSSGRRGM